jgi:hypothetical protein
VKETPRNTTKHGDCKNLPSENSSHHGNHGDKHDGKESDSSRKPRSEEKGLERGGEEVFFLLNDASSKRIRQQRMAQEDQRGACLQPSTAERTAENETAA